MQTLTGLTLFLGCLTNVYLCTMTFGGALLSNDHDNLATTRAASVIEVQPPTHATLEVDSRYKSTLITLNLYMLGVALAIILVLCSPRLNWSSKLMLASILALSFAQTKYMERTAFGPNVTVAVESADWTPEQKFAHELHYGLIFFIIGATQLAGFRAVFTEPVSVAKLEEFRAAFNRA